MRQDAFGEPAPMPATQAIAGSIKTMGAQARGFGANWFTELVAGYLHWRDVRGRRVSLSEDLTQEEQAQAIIRQACIKTALTGATAGVLATSATVVTGETGGSGAIFAVPAGLLSLGAEMIARAVLHLQMTCDLADVFCVSFDPDDPEDLWRLYALAFHTEAQSEGGKNPDRELVHRIIDPEDEEIGSDIGSKLLKESVLRNVVPFIGIGSSALTNWRLTRNIGDAVRRYCRYQRALTDVLKRHPRLRSEHIDLVIEGLWFVFSSDGHLSIQEAATLAQLLRKSPPQRRRALENRLVANRSAWLKRLSTLPPKDRPAMFHLLEVACAMDKAYSLPERELLTDAAEALDMKLDPKRVPNIVQQLQDVGVLKIPGKPTARA